MTFSPCSFVRARSLESSGLSGNRRGQPAFPMYMRPAGRAKAGRFNVASRWNASSGRERKRRYAAKLSAVSASVQSPGSENAAAPRSHAAFCPAKLRAVVST